MTGVYVIRMWTYSHDNNNMRNVSIIYYYYYYHPFVLNVDICVSLSYIHLFSFRHEQTLPKHPGISCVEWLQSCSLV